MFDTITLESSDQLYVATPAFMLAEDRETAWAGAAGHIVQRPDLSWLMGRFVQAEKPNGNGHEFALSDLVDAHKLVPLTPLDMLHQKKHVVGAFAASELIYPTGWDDSMLTDAANLATDQVPIVEALSYVWKNSFPDEAAAIADANDNGRLWYSMSCVGDSLTCTTPGHCGQTFPYKGPYHQSYCEAMQELRSRRRINMPFFTGGAVIIPPVKPGWANADLRRIAANAETHPAAAVLYDDIAAAAPHLDPAEWEMLMAHLLAGMFDDDTERAAQQFSFDWEGITARIEEHLFSVPRVPAAPVAPTVEPVIDAGGGSGVIVALVPPQAVRDALAALGNETADDIHVTLAYLGKSTDGSALDQPPGSDDTVTKDRVVGAVAVFAAMQQPLARAIVSGRGTFTLPTGGEVTYASLDCPGLNEMRACLVRVLDAADVPVASDHGFTPHMSYAYHDPGKGPTGMPESAPFPVGEIELWWQGERTDFDLSGSGGLIDELLARGLVTQENIDAVAV